MIAIINYNAGNTKSVMHALEKIGASYVLTNDANEILKADKVIFPGVGHAKHAMNTLISLDLVDTIKSITAPLLGICIGMQLLYESSEEGETECLGIISGQITKFQGELIIPQMGWNTVHFEENPLFCGIDKGSWFYSVHSYRAECGDETIATSNYGGEYSSAVQKDNFYGVQFHPEKSAQNGQKLIKNFLQL